jgi:hypothetical protein
MDKKKVVNILYAVLIPLFFIFLLISIFGYEKISQMQTRGIGENVCDINLLFPKFDNKFSNHRYLKISIFSLLDILLIVGYFVGFPYRKKVYIIRQITYNSDTAPYDKNLKKTNKIKEFEINQVAFFKKKDLKNCLDIQDNMIKKIKNKRASYYYGIAPIPFIFRLGFKLGDENKGIFVLHKKRQASAVFSSLEDKEEKYKYLTSNLIDNPSVKNQDLLVVIATSLPVNDTDIKIIYDKCCGKLIFNPENESDYDFDYFSSYPQIERTKQLIVDEIRKTIKNKNIKRLHFVLATSSDFVFSFSRMFSDYHDPEIIVYHYICKSDQAYPWGVIINNESENAIIFNKTSSNPIILKDN